MGFLKGEASNDLGINHLSPSEINHIKVITTSGFSNYFYLS